MWTTRRWAPRPSTSPRTRTPMSPPSRPAGSTPKSSTSAAAGRRTSWATRSTPASLALPRWSDREGCHFGDTAVTRADGIGQADGHGGSYAGVRDRPAASWTGWCRSRAGRQRHRNRGAAAPVDGGAPAGHPAAVHAAGPAGVGDVGATAAPRPVAGLPGYPFDAAALAPGAGGPSLDLSTDWALSARFGHRGRRSGGADGAGEPTLGIRTDRGGVPQARRAGVGNVGAPDPAPPPAGPGAAAD